MATALGTWQPKSLCRPTGATPILGRLAGERHVSSVPSVGAIAQASADSLGHVAIVDAVNGDQIHIRDMNNYGGGGGGYGRVGQATVSAASYSNYITAP